MFDLSFINDPYLSKENRFKLFYRRIVRKIVRSNFLKSVSTIPNPLAFDIVDILEPNHILEFKSEACDIGG